MGVVLSFEFSESFSTIIIIRGGAMLVGLKPD